MVISFWPEWPHATTSLSISVDSWLSQSSTEYPAALAAFSTARAKLAKNGFLLPRASTLTLALLALTFSWVVEFSQLYHAPWIDAIRTTLPGRLVLGSTFNWPDLPAYALGVGVGAWTERRLWKTARV